MPLLIPIIPGWKYNLRTSLTEVTVSGFRDLLIITKFNVIETDFIFCYRSSPCNEWHLT